MGDHWRFVRWRWQHKTLARLIPHRLASWLVWREAMDDPEFVARMDAGLADIRAGRVVPWEAVRRTLAPVVEDVTRDGRTP